MPEINFEAEQAVLGCLLIDGQLIKECELRAGHFGNEQNGIIFKTMQLLDRQSKPIDIVTVTERLRTSNQLELVGGSGYLAALQNAVPTTFNFDHYQRSVVEDFKMREARKAIKQCEIHSPEEIGELISTLVKIDELGERSRYDHKETVAQVYEEIVTPPADARVLTGYNDLDRMLTTIEGGQLIVIAARPAVGKTDVAVNIARETAKRGTMVHFYSLEMGKKALHRRMLAAESRIPAKKLKKGNLDTGEWERLSLAVGGFAELPIEMQDNFVSTVAEIRANTRKIMREHPDKQHLIMIDYLQLVQGTRTFKNKNDEVTEVSRDLKLMALRLNVPVIALSQLNRGPEGRQDKRPTMADLRDSGAIEQDADTIIFLFRDDYYRKDSEKRNILELIIGKQREGPTGTVELVYFPNFNLLMNLKREPASAE